MASIIRRRPFLYQLLWAFFLTPEGKKCHGFRSGLLPRQLRNNIPTCSRIKQQAHDKYTRGLLKKNYRTKPLALFHDALFVASEIMSTKGPDTIHATTNILSKTPDAFHSATTILSNSVENLFSGKELPFADLGKELTKSLDIGSALKSSEGQVSEEETIMVLGTIGQDLLTFLAASVVVTTVSNFVGITPILGYLLVGACLGPNGLDFFSNSEAGVELGDFGILFLLFSEGLEVTSERLRKLANFLPLGFAQISLTTGVLTAGLLLSAKFLHYNDPLMRITDPVQAVILAIVGALSTSAFIFPVLKERGWEEEESGEAATTILLLQDLLVAPLLVILPYLVSDGPTDFGAIGSLTAIATLGFGSVIAVSSIFLRGLFRLVSQTRSSETFVALCLLVSAGMGEIARTLGLTDTAGAFAAGVLLANTNYRAQIQADILPFKGILLGIFFMDAGSNFDTELVLSNLSTVILGAVSLVAAKGLTLGAATRVPEQFEPNRLPTVDAIRVAVLLSGGGEFAFVVLALAQKLDVLPDSLIGLLTAIVLVTMGITPLLGDLAAKLSEPYEKNEEETQQPFVTPEPTEVAEDSIVVCGHGEAGRATKRVLGERYAHEWSPESGKPNVVAFSRNPCLSDSTLTADNNTIVLYGDGGNPEVIRSSGITNPKAIFIAYREHSKVISATSRLRSTFVDTPIYSRASNRREVKYLQLVGATEAVVECDELARSATLLMEGKWKGPLQDTNYDSDEETRAAASVAAAIPYQVVDDLFELYDSLDSDASGLLDRAEVMEMFRKTKGGFIASDSEIKQMDQWLATTTSANMDPIDKIEFCRLYQRAPDFVKASFGNIRDSNAPYQANKV